MAQRRTRRRPFLAARRLLLGAVGVAGVVAVAAGAYVYSEFMRSLPPIGAAVDWGFAASIGAKLARSAAPVTEYTRQQAISQLAESARAAEPPVREVTRLITEGAVPEARIVDRPAWIRAATESMRAMTGGAATPKGVLTGRVTGAQTGAVLAFVSSGILGQYDPFVSPTDDGGGCLLLVYPNIIAVERQLDHSLDEMMTRLARIPLRHQPGTTWEYSISADVQARLVEILAGTSIDRFLQSPYCFLLALDQPGERIDAYGACPRAAP